MEILHLAERLSATPRLIPENSRDRVQMFGLANELMSEDGLVWCRRLMMFDVMSQGQSSMGGFAQLRGRDYGYVRHDVERAPQRVLDILALFAEVWRAQRALGRRYLLGEGLTALDIYWATMSAIVAPLPPEQCPMPNGLRAAYTQYPEHIRAAVDPALLEHRDFIYRTYLTMPIDT